MRYISILFVLMIGLYSCESMEDTYDEYSGEGKIRYVGKVNDLKIETGWKRFKFTWNNTVDATIDSIRLDWYIGDELIGYKLFDKDVDTYQTDPIFKNENYIFKFYSIDTDVKLENGDSKKSLISMINGRPFSDDHERIRSLDKIENKYFFVDNNLVILLNTLNSNIIDPVIQYFQIGNDAPTNLSVTTEMIDDRFLVIKNVDVNKAVTVTRSIDLDDCYDIIESKSYTLISGEVSLHAVFKNYLKLQYHLAEEDIEEFRKTATTLHIDYTITTIEDILAFPNLEKVVFGAHRYMHDYHTFSNLSYFKDLDVCLFALETVHDLRGVKLDVYNENFFSPYSYEMVDAAAGKEWVDYYYLYDILYDIDFVNNMGNPELPEITPLDNTGWTIESSTKEEGDESHPEYLLDNDVSTVWKPAQVETRVRDHHLVIDMQGEKNIKGFLFRQPDRGYNTYFQTSVKIFVSNDGSIWEEAFEENLRYVGDGKGEVTNIVLKNEKRCRYVKLVAKDKIGNRRYTMISDFVIY